MSNSKIILFCIDFSENEKRNEGVETNKYENLENLTNKYEHLAQRVPKGSQKGAKVCQKGAKGSQKGAKREPKASQREPKASQRRTRMLKQIYARKKVPRRSDHGDEILHFWSHFDELKTLKSIEKHILFLIFVIFGKVEKKKKQQFWN